MLSSSLMLALYFTVQNLQNPNLNLKQCQKNYKIKIHLRISVLIGKVKHSFHLISKICPANKLT